MYKLIEIKDSDQNKQVLVNLDQICMIYPSNEGTLIYINSQYVLSTLTFNEFSDILQDQILG